MIKKPTQKCLVWLAAILLTTLPDTSHANVPDAGTLVSTITAACKQHPALTTLAVATAAYGISYATTQIMSHNKQIQVELVNYSAPQSTATTAQGNYLLVHGLAESHKQALWYIKKPSNRPFIIDGQLFTYDFPDVTQHFWRVNFTQTGLGQHHEVMGLKSAYEQTIATLNEQGASNKDVILVGMSRGATTILNFMGLHKPENVKALVVESPFDATHSIAKNMLKKMHLDGVPGMQTIAHWIMSAVFWQHSTSGICAKDMVETIDKELPILLVCSKQDKLVPAESTTALYQALKKSGHTKVHIYTAETGRHGRILYDSDCHNYQHVTHAFYKKYGLPHDPALATLGASLFDQCQPL
ncbi:MAG: prolyl oligopeptidase family serine peptidase [Candidatus Dependentiae bacterium]|nr:prolyl oligopeptidase family serine peptidase [Candidatus Dependentiae bacterium]